MSKPAPTSDQPPDVPPATAPQGVAAESRRLRVTQRDLDMYAALVGVPQTLLLAEEPPVPASPLRIDRAWLSSWVRGLSRRARQKFDQAKVRLVESTRKPRA